MLSCARVGTTTACDVYKIHIAAGIKITMNASLMSQGEFHLAVVLIRYDIEQNKMAYGTSENFLYILPATHFPPVCGVIHFKDYARYTDGNPPNS